MGLKDVPGANSLIEETALGCFRPILGDARITGFLKFLSIYLLKRWK